MEGAGCCSINNTDNEFVSFSSLLSSVAASTVRSLFFQLDMHLIGIIVLMIQSSFSDCARLCFVAQQHLDLCYGT